ncbi:helix-turn-helix transcriptional regulator [Paenibacillus sp. FSL H7-0716]|uniref:helix-turn-helix transcriptional regulator n=1 Tax=Paenibacillus TaxID=44249 RepID=UPI002115F955|nr:MULTISPECIES: helix-turn-helix transcriptional regulator [Paenibacillus]MDH6427221.1 putative transcriptional regulator [Paenibacillus sp. PastH-4]MDH6443250.1 putative transcriptional regulator [Paenibacillus sp. PastF-4]MDH6526045.1 putative transcriptional regulator [Paenibacillus sp. PastH-3]
MNFKRVILIEARKRKGWTQEELASGVGISRAYLANIERGEYDPSLKVAQSLSKKLGVSTDKLFFNDNARKTNVNKEVI